MIKNLSLDPQMFLDISQSNTDETRKCYYMAKMG